METKQIKVSKQESTLKYPEAQFCERSGAASAFQIGESRPNEM